MLVKHLRDDAGFPFATVVAIGPDQIGVSVCSTKDHFVKKMGVRIAEGRARLRSFDISFVPNQKVVYKQQIMTVEDVIKLQVLAMSQRAQKYFKESV